MHSRAVLADKGKCMARAVKQSLCSHVLFAPLAGLREASTSATLQATTPLQDTAAPLGCTTRWQERHKLRSSTTGAVAVAACWCVDCSLGGLSSAVPLLEAVEPCTGAHRERSCSAPPLRHRW